MSVAERAITDYSDDELRAVHRNLMDAMQRYLEAFVVVKEEIARRDRLVIPPNTDQTLRPADTIRLTQVHQP